MSFHISASFIFYSFTIILSLISLYQSRFPDLSFHPVLAIFQTGVLNDFELGTCKNEKLLLSAVEKLNIIYAGKSIHTKMDRVLYRRKLVNAVVYF